MILDFYINFLLAPTYDQFFLQIKKYFINQ